MTGHCIHSTFSPSSCPLSISDNTWNCCTCTCQVLEEEYYLAANKLEELMSDDPKNKLAIIRKDQNNEED